MMSFAVLYNTYAEMVYNLCLNYLQNQQDAEEVTQDVFVKVDQQLYRFEGRSAEKTWIYRIAINQCLDFLKARRRLKRFGWVIPLATQDSSAHFTSFDHPGVLLEDKEALEALFKKINALPEQQKTALLLKTMEHCSQQEIADIMEISTKAVESLLSRARKNLSAAKDF